MSYNANPFQITEVFTTVVPWKANVFLEGAVMFRNYIYVLTWQEHLVYKLDPATYSLVNTLSWGKDGWGLTQNGTYMFATDGSDSIYLVDDAFNLVGQKQIVDTKGRRLFNMNEL
jgi:glutamine cyclotransferase